MAPSPRTMRIERTHTAFFLPAIKILLLGNHRELQDLRLTQVGHLNMYHVHPCGNREPGLIGQIPLQELTWIVSCRASGSGCLPG